MRRDALANCHHVTASHHHSSPTDATIHTKSLVPTNQPITTLPCIRPRFLASSFSNLDPYQSTSSQSLLNENHRRLKALGTMSPSITNTMRRFSRGSGNRNSTHSTTNPTNNTGTYTPPLSQSQGGQPQSQGISRTSTSNDPQLQHNSRPVSSDSSTSFEHMNRPVSQQYNQGSAAHMSHLPQTPAGMNALPGGHQSVPHSAIGGLSRTDQVVLRYFWEEKYLDNAKRDLHFVSLMHPSTLLIIHQ